jgi:hypothetical protein
MWLPSSGDLFFFFATLSQVLLGDWDSWPILQTLSAKLASNKKSTTEFNR